MNDAPFLSPGDLETFARFAEQLADASGAVIRPWFRVPLDVVDKGAGKAVFDPVTEADRAAELELRRRIQSAYPTHGILGEEHGHTPGDGNYTWVLDPIDGTRAFICGMPQWGTLIALSCRERPVLGVIDQPFTRERWVGFGGKTVLTTSEGSRVLRTRACEGLRSAVLTTTHPSSHFTPAEASAFGELATEAKMTRYGGDCYAYGLLAAGFIDVIVEAGLAPWDVCALIPVIEGAGGVMSSWDGSEPQRGGRIVAAGDRRVHAEVLARLRDVR